jgi:hypothetical protein
MAVKYVLTGAIDMLKMYPYHEGHGQLSPKILVE